VGWHHGAARERWFRAGVRWSAASAGRRLTGHLVTRLASAKRDAWGWVGGGRRRNAAKYLRAVAGAEASAICAYSRGFQIRA